MNTMYNVNESPYALPWRLYSIESDAKQEIYVQALYSECTEAYLNSMLHDKIAGDVKETCYAMELAISQIPSEGVFPKSRGH